MRVTQHGAAEPPPIEPDIVWNGETGDLALTALDAALNPASLQSGQGLRTAIVIALMTDRRADPTELRDGDINRGWPGDGFDLAPGEAPLGSKLWLLRRSVLTEQTARRAEDHAREALQPLLDQGVFVRFDVAAQIAPERNRLDLSIDGYGRDGTQRHHERFAIHWEHP